MKLLANPFLLITIIFSLPCSGEVLVDASDPSMVAPIKESDMKWTSTSAIEHFCENTAMIVEGARIREFEVIADQCYAAWGCITKEVEAGENPLNRVSCKEISQDQISNLVSVTKSVINSRNELCSDKVDGRLGGRTDRNQKCVFEYVHKQLKPVAMQPATLPPSGQGQGQATTTAPANTSNKIEFNQCGESFLIGLQNWIRNKCDFQIKVEYQHYLNGQPYDVQVYPLGPGGQDRLRQSGCSTLDNCAHMWQVRQVTRE